MSHFWDGFEKRAFVAPVHALSALASKVRAPFTAAAGAARAGGQAAGGMLRTAKTYGKGMLMGGALTAGGMTVANAAGGQGGMQQVQ